MMDEEEGVPIKQILAQSSVPVLSDVARLRKTLEQNKFQAQAEIWSGKTGAGSCTYSVSVLKNPFKVNSPGRIVIELSCEKTPKLSEVPGWKPNSPLSWKYQLSKTPAEEVDVIIRAHDNKMLDALVGACIHTVRNSEPGEDGKKDPQPIKESLTLGLIFRYRNSDKWAILVGHVFQYSLVRKAGQRTTNTYSNAGNQLLSCGPSDFEKQCSNCLSGCCLSACGSTKHMTLAQGNQQIFRSTTEFLFDMSIAKIPHDDPAVSIRRLDVRDFVKFLTKQKRETYADGELDKAMECVNGLKGVAKKFAAPELLQQCLMNENREGGPMLMFKKGMATGWTWGWLYSSTSLGFSVASSAVDEKETPLAGAGDCGAIWFIVDSTARTAIPVGWHHARPKEPEKIGEARVYLALGHHYTAAFSQNGPAVDNINKISGGFQETDILIKYKDCFSPIV